MIILRRREAYRAAFADFEPTRIARFDGRKVEALMRNDTIIRNRLKIKSAINNARAYLALREAGNTLDPVRPSIRLGRAFALPAGSMVEYHW